MVSIILVTYINRRVFGDRLQLATVIDFLNIKLKSTVGSVRAKKRCHPRRVEHEPEPPRSRPSQALTKTNLINTGFQKHHFRKSTPTSPEDLTGMRFSELIPAMFNNTTKSLLGYVTLK